jgi:mRNA interferase MazF
MLNVERGHIIYLDFDPAAGHEQQKRRPALIISDGYIDPVNNHFAMVVPITNRERSNPFHVKVPNDTFLDNGKLLTGVALTEQAKSLDLSGRNAQVVGTISLESIFFKTVISYVRSILA